MASPKIIRVLREVTELAGPAQERNRQCIGILERLLGQAKDGQMLDMIVHARYRDGSVETSWTATDDVEQVCGGLLRMAFRRLRR